MHNIIVQKIFPIFGTGVPIFLVLGPFLKNWVPILGLFFKVLSSNFWAWVPLLWQLYICTMYILHIIQAYYLSGGGVNLCITTAEDPIEYCNTFLVLIIVVLSLRVDDCKCCNEWEKVIKKT